MAVLPLYAFDPERCIGTISEVGPSTAKVNLPTAAAAEGRLQYGYRLGGGEVGEFAFVECGAVAVFGRIIAVRLPERERLAVEHELGIARETHPIGTLQLLTTIDLTSGRVLGGISAYPRLGARVYAVHPSLLKWIAEAPRGDRSNATPLVVPLATLQGDPQTIIRITPERLFGRHCAVLGSTGGGKSWTLARLLEGVSDLKAKVLLFDATGEFRTLRRYVQHIHLGHDPSPPTFSAENVLPYNHLTEGDLFALFKPSGQSQAPKLRAAMKSLKVQRAAGQVSILKKAALPRSPIALLFRTHAAVAEGPLAEFDITKLSRQIEEECVYQTDKNNASNFGAYNEGERSYCTTLVTRIEDMIRAFELECIFQPVGKPSLLDTLEAFLQAADTRILCVSLRHLPFAHNAREIVANAIGRHVLGLARQDRFRNAPLLICLDEAHQFLDKALGDDNSRFPLDAFELIAKEGRKYSLTICIATQRPRDIPEGVLSQMGTLIVHRLINDRDREVVERASGDIDRSAAEFLPTLAEGEAVIIGVDFPIPLTLQVIAPVQKPDSYGPDYQVHWAFSP